MNLVAYWGEPMAVQLATWTAESKAAWSELQKVVRKDGCLVESMVVLLDVKKAVSTALLMAG